MRRGFTLSEVLVVASILAILAAIGYQLSAPSRRNAVQLSCMSRLRQIHMATVMYGDDADVTEEVPGLPGFSTKAGAPNLLRYLGQKDFRFFFCPEYPGGFHPKLGGSYGWGVVPEWAVDRTNPAELEVLRRNREEILALGSSYPYRYCLIHDQLHYYPHEQVASGFPSPAFVIELRWNGSVTRGRSARYERSSFEIPLPEEER